MRSNLVIFSAELISPELQVFFGALPSALVPFEGKTALDFIYFENKNHYKTIYIVAYRNVELIQQYIENKQYDIQLITLDRVQDLAYTLSYCLSKLKNLSETTFIFGDTYLPYMSSFLDQQNVVFYAHAKDCARWTVLSFDLEQIHFIDKKILEAKTEYEVVVGAFHIVSPENLLQIIHENPNRSFYQYLEDYFNQFGFEAVYSKEWIDFGHSDMYFEHKFNVESREFNEIKIDTLNKVLTKTSKNTDKFINECSWFLHLPESLKKYIPKIYSVSLDKNAPSIQMEYLNYLTLHELYIFGNHKLDVWKKIIQQLKALNSEFVAVKSSDLATLSALNSIYIEKTLARLKDFEKQELIDFHNEITINGINYPAIDTYIKSFARVLNHYQLLEPRPFNIIHGDFFLANILFDIKLNQLKLVDPRGEFGSSSIFGDNLYEWAKLAHSFDGKYDVIVSDKFDLFVSSNGSQLLYNLHESELYAPICDYFYSTCVEEKDIAKVKIIQALLFFSMLPLHKDKPKRQLMMLCKAVELFHPYFIYS